MVYFKSKYWIAYKIILKFPPELLRKFTSTEISADNNFLRTVYSYLQEWLKIL